MRQTYVAAFAEGIPYWDGAARVMCAPMVPTLLAESAQSVIQVKPTGSALMRIGSALSGSRPGTQGLCRAQEEKKSTVKHS